MTRVLSALACATWLVACGDSHGPAFARSGDEPEQEMAGSGEAGEAGASANDTSSAPTDEPPAGEPREPVDTNAGEPEPDTSSGLIYAGSGLVNYFRTDEGMFLVEETGVVFRSWDGSGELEWTAERLVKTAAFDGELLVVADAANLVTLDLNLETVTEGSLVEVCEYGVMVGGGRFVCGPENDWDRVFYTYDARTGDLLASSQAYTYNGIPMRRVPGMDRFICVSGGSPSDFHLYGVDGDTDEAVYIGESPYHGDFGVLPDYGFAFDPVTHVITHEGLMLRIESADCDPSMNSFTSGCFLKDGSLGTLPGDAARYLATAADGGDHVLALIDANGFSFSSGSCFDELCIVQRVELSSKDVVAEGYYSAAEDMSAFYLAPGPSDDRPVIIASGRSIYRTGRDDTLPYSVRIHTFAE